MVQNIYTKIKILRQVSLCLSVHASGAVFGVSKCDVATLRLINSSLNGLVLDGRRQVDPVDCGALFSDWASIFSQQ